ncbi:MAG: cyclodeaminase/cyclohydrolase family protein [Gemmatimonadota bacterium]
MDANTAAFLRVLDAKDDSTGGGTASAVAGAMAAALAGMVSRLSVGKQGMEPETFYREIGGEAERLAAELFDGGRQDSEAFDAVMSAFRLPKGTNEEKAARSRAIQEATVRATRVPLANAERVGRALELAARLKGRSNPNAASDLTCAQALGRAALAGCLANVEINLAGIRDEKVRSELAARAAVLREAHGLG